MTQKQQRTARQTLADNNREIELDGNFYREVKPKAHTLPAAALPDMRQNDRYLVIHESQDGSGSSFLDRLIEVAYR